MEFAAILDEPYEAITPNETSNDYPPAPSKSKALWISLSLMGGIVFVFVTTLVLANKYQSRSPDIQANSTRNKDGLTLPPPGPSPDKDGLTLPPPGPSPDKDGLTLPPPGPSPDNELLNKVLQHTFWQVKVTRPMLMRVIDEIRIKPADTLAYIDDKLNYAFHQGPMASGLRDIPYAAIPKGVNHRCIVIDFAMFSKRPSQMDILEVMPAKLDRREFVMPGR